MLPQGLNTLHVAGCTRREALLDQLDSMDLERHHVLRVEGDLCNSEPLVRMPRDKG
jgi:hypothetical protein